MFLAPLFVSKLFVISIPGLFFDFHLNRILIVTYFFLFFHELFKKKWSGDPKNRKLVQDKYEIWLIIYCLVIFFSTGFNAVIERLTLKDFIVINTNELFFPLLYFCLKLFAEPQIFEKFKKVIIILSVFLSFTAFVQFFIYSEFFRFGAERIAFGDNLRSTGFFYNEYTLGFFCIMAISLLLTSRKTNYFFLSINIIAVVLTFHRLSIGLMILSILFYFGVNIHKKKVHSLVFLSLVLSASISYYLLVLKDFQVSNLYSTDLFTERFSQDTLTGRLDQYNNAINIIKKNPFGYGSYDTEEYVEASAEIGQLQYIEEFDYDTKTVSGKKLVGLIVHNGFLGAGVRYGALGSISYFMFCFSTILYAYKKNKKNDSFTLLMVCVVWFLYQMTQDFSFLSSFAAIYFALFLGVFKISEHQIEMVQ